MSKTMWKPDTCNCQVLIEYDDLNLNAPPKATVVSACDLHTGAKGEAILEDNQKKNHGISIMASHLGVGMTEIGFERDKDGEHVFFHKERKLSDGDKKEIEAQLRNLKLTSRVK